MAGHGGGSEKNLPNVGASAMIEFETPKLWLPVLDFWFEDGLEKGWPSQNMGQIWFGGSQGLDDTIRERFEVLVEAALWNELVDWEAKPLTRLGLIILLDQFTRNIYRGEAKAFSGDHGARTLVMEGVARGMDEKLPWVGRVFFYMPLMHAEDMTLQNESVSCFQRLVEQAPEDIADKVKGNLQFAIEHREVIERFGRFPHRNKALGRESTEEEKEYLENAKRYGQ